MENIFGLAWTTLQPYLVAGCTIVGAGTVAMWLKKKGFLGEKHYDRRKDNSDVLGQFLRIADQNAKVIQKLVDINEEQKDILKNLAVRQTSIHSKIDQIHDAVVEINGRSLSEGTF